MSLLTYVLDRFFGFIHYNVQYVTFIAAYITLKSNFNIKLWHIKTS